jgi:molybdopterin-guanine dinucleotide biosynthesis protein MobB
MQRIHIVGRKNHGKTQLVVELVEEFARRGLRVGTVKHTHHRHELDTPGKDSHRHRTSGAAVVGVVSQGMSAVFVPTPANIGSRDRYAAMAPMFADCDIVLVEGDSQTDAPKVEVWREIQQTAALAADDASILAVVTDDLPDVRVPLLQRSDVPQLADWLLAHAARPIRA